MRCCVFPSRDGPEIRRPPVLGLLAFLRFFDFARSRRISWLRCSGDFPAQRAAADFRCIARMYSDIWSLIRRFLKLHFRRDR